jgi:hypothetical protein
LRSDRVVYLRRAHCHFSNHLPLIQLLLVVLVVLLLRQEQ